MSIQKQYSSIDNISIAGSHISFDVTANDTFDIVSISYNNSSRYCLGLDDIDITEQFVPTQEGNLNSGSLSLCLDNSENCSLSYELSQYLFDEVLNIFTVVTSETPNENCVSCDQDIYLVFDYLGELNKLGEKIISQYSSCECIDVTTCDLEKGFLIELMSTQDKVNTVSETVEFYKKYKDLCCD